MRYGSVCSGIEAASVAWHPLGWEAQWLSEIEAFPSAVLAHRFPNVPNLGDMTKIHENETFKQSTIDVLVGGTPCQSFSVAGLRKGLDDPRGNLMLAFLNLAGRKRPTWVVWENVPGVLSSNEGRDFGTFLSGLAELGYGFAYRVLDAQYFGVAQRRRRVFVVGYIGDWRPAAAVLFERHSLSGHPAPSRETREGAAKGVEIGVGSGKWWDGKEIASTLTTKSNEQRMPDKDNAQLVVCTLGHTESNGLGIKQTETANTLEATSSVNQAVAHAFKVRGGCDGGGKGYLGQDEAAFTISTGQDQMVAQPIVLEDQGGSIMNVSDKGVVGALMRETHGHEPALIHGTAIRRLTPVECERLQGFPDNWTKIPYRNKPADQCPDGPRYKACGNSMAVPVMRWIGQRIQMVSELL